MMLVILHAPLFSAEGILCELSGQMCLHVSVAKLENFSPKKMTAIDEIERMYEDDLFGIC